MKKIFLIVSLFLTTLAIADDLRELKVGIVNFAPPYVMHAANKKFYGFDVAIANYICASLKSRCSFKTFEEKELFNAVLNNKIDIAISNLTITSQRARKIIFSIPYALSSSQFLVRVNDFSKAFKIDILKGKKIGYLEGSIFSQQLLSMGVSSENIKGFTKTPDLVEALGSGAIELAIMDEHSADFWSAQSAGILKTFGAPFSYGFGYGVAVHPNDKRLLNAINLNIKKYLNSPLYKENFVKYFGVF